MKGDTTMHPMRLTNKQIQEIMASVRKDLKTFKTIHNALSINFKLPVQERPKAKLVIELKAWLKMSALIDECDKEIAWHGLVEKNDNIYTIKDIIIFPQTVTGTTVNSDETEYSLWLAQQPNEIFDKLRFHGHSHVNMGVNPSGVDKDYQENMIRNVQDFYIFSIFNKKGDNWCTIYDVKDNIVYEDTDIELHIPTAQAEAWAKAAIKEYVTVYKAPTKPKTKSKKSSVYDDDDDEYIYGSNDAYRYYGGFGYYGQK